MKTPLTHVVLWSPWSGISGSEILCSCTGKVLYSVVVELEEEHPAPFICLPQPGHAGSVSSGSHGHPFSAPFSLVHVKGFDLALCSSNSSLLISCYPISHMELCVLEAGHYWRRSLEPILPILPLILPAHYYLQEIFQLKILGLILWSPTLNSDHALPPAMLESFYFSLVLVGYFLPLW